MASKKHIHKYHVIKMHGIDIWACALPDCSHYTPNHLKESIPGKATLCWQCNNQMILDEENMKMAKPICLDCMHPELASKEHEVYGKLDIYTEYLANKRKEQVK